MKTKLTQEQCETLIRIFTQIRDAFKNPPEDRRTSRPCTHWGVCRALAGMIISYETEKLGLSLIYKYQPQGFGSYFWPIYTYDWINSEKPFTINPNWNRSFDLKRVDLCNKIIRYLKRKLRAIVKAQESSKVAQ